MEFSIATLLSHFSDDKLVAGKVLEKKLHCEDEVSIEKLRVALDALEKVGVLTKNLGKYRRVYEDDVVEAKLRCSSKGFCFAIQGIEGADDIYVRESNLSNAWNGDRVLVKIIKEGSRRRSPEGEVKLIIDRSNPSLLARIKKIEEGYRAVPLDDRLLFELNLKDSDENSNSLKSSIDHLVHVEVSRYPLGSNLPQGQVTRVLGSDAEAAADTDIVCCKHDLPQTFSEKVLDEANHLPRQVPRTEIKKRLDLRNQLTITLEPNQASNSSDPLIENALTLSKNDDGHWQLGLHIADVSHYIKPDSALDLEAKKRGTAIYVGDLVLPLFPEVVHRRCSLVTGKDRLTISVLITLDETGKILEFEIQPSAIHVDHQLSYEYAQSLLGEMDQVDKNLVPVVDLLKNLLLNVSPLLKAQRLQRGGFDINLAEAQSAFKDEGRLGTVVVDSTLPVRSLLTELALIPGRVVALHLKNFTLPALYSIESEPDLDELEDLLKLGANLGLDVTLGSEEEIIPLDYQRLTRTFTDSDAPKILTYFLQESLESVTYSTKPGAHFGLAYSDGYLHCISPTQRYGDLLNQRVLKILFEHGRDRRNNRMKTGVNLGSSTSHGEVKWNVIPPAMQTQLEEMIAKNLAYLNEREKLAQDAETDLAGLKKSEQMKERTGDIFKGLITGVQSYGFFVEIEDLLVEGLVHVSSLKDDWYEYRSRHSCLIGRKNRIAYRLGDRVEVQVKSVDYYRQQIDLVTVSGGSEASSEDLEDE